MVGSKTLFFLTDYKNRRLRLEFGETLDLKKREMHSEGIFIFEIMVYFTGEIQREITM